MNPDDADEFDERPRRPARGDRPRRKRSGDIEPVEFFVPSGSPWAIFSLYAGLVGFCLPFIGLLFAVPALIAGIIALRRWKRSDTYGGATSNIRAILGVILSGLGVLIWGPLTVYLLIAGK